MTSAAFHARYSGVVTKPAKADIMFVPQRPYLVMGTLRDQITYPDSAEVMRAKSVRALASPRA
jgi:ABC-type uncharacterized transport system fused permease/ATPase subunit|eukprot:COSAG01_NODE_947_length_12532_cov_15.427388_3_plen_63_part_00